MAVDEPAEEYVFKYKQADSTVYVGNAVIDTAVYEQDSGCYYYPLSVSEGVEPYFYVKVRELLSPEGFYVVGADLSENIVYTRETYTSTNSSNGDVTGVVDINNLSSYEKLYFVYSGCNLTSDSDYYTRADFNVYAKLCHTFMWHEDISYYIDETYLFKSIYMFKLNTYGENVKSSYKFKINEGSRLYCVSKNLESLSEDSEFSDYTYFVHWADTPIVDFNYNK